MNPTTNPTTQPTTRAIVLTRVFDAPRELVFDAWTDATQLAQWFGPESFTNPVCEVDARPGGELYIVMRGPDGTDYPMRGEFKEVVRPERLVFTSEALDSDGNALLRGLATVTFEDANGKTRLTLETSATGLAPIAEQMLEGMEAGWSQSLDGLQTLIAKSA